MQILHVQCHVWSWGCECHIKGTVCSRSFSPATSKNPNIIMLANLFWLCAFVVHAANWIWHLYTRCGTWDTGHLCILCVYVYICECDFSIHINIIVNIDYQRLFETQFELKQGERFCRNVTIINDRMVEGREFFLVVLEDLRWGEIIETLAIVIEDEDCKIIISS